MNFIKEYSGVVALVILAILGMLSIGGVGQKSLFGTTACSNTTCLAGGLRLVTDLGGDFEVDVASVFSGISTFTGNATFASTTITALKIGQLGTQQSNSVVTTCSPIANISAATNTPAYAYCTGVSGVTSADFVTASFSTSTVGFDFSNNFYVASAKASTTPGAIDFEIGNLSGQAQAPSAASRIASTTVIRAGH